MKKVLLIAVAGVFALGLTSCKKDYTCTCDSSSVDITIPLNDYKKKDATTACDNAEATYKQGIPNMECTLK